MFCLHFLIFEGKLAVLHWHGVSECCVANTVLSLIKIGDSISRICNNSLSLTHKYVQYWQKNTLLPKLKYDPWNRKDVAMEKWSNAQCSCDTLMNRIFFWKIICVWCGLEGPNQMVPMNRIWPPAWGLLTGRLLHFLSLGLSDLYINVRFTVQIYIQFYKSVTFQITFTNLDIQFKIVIFKVYFFLFKGFIYAIDVIPRYLDYISLKTLRCWF